MAASHEEIALEREKFEFYKSQVELENARIEQCHRRKAYFTMISYSIIIVLVIIVLYFALIYLHGICSKSSKQEGFSPYASTLIHDSPRSDPAFDRSREGYLSENSLFQIPHPIADSLYY